MRFVERINLIRPIYMDVPFMIQNDPVLNKKYKIINDSIYTHSTDLKNLPPEMDYKLLENEIEGIMLDLYLLELEGTLSLKKVHSSLDELDAIADKLRDQFEQINQFLKENDYDSFYKQDDPRDDF